MSNQISEINNMLTIKDLIAKWRLSRNTIFGYLQEDRIKGAIKIGNKWYFPKDVEKPEDRRFKNL